MTEKYQVDEITLLNAVRRCEMLSGDIEVLNGRIEQQSKLTERFKVQQKKLLHMTLWQRIKFVFLGIDYAREVIRIHS